ncbi:HET-domain-containing protein [Westerdykella ornata]|uniref:HET-domain-containing protein n=1 Tax=Westerdykella ornata TaxID=318751 RepID=A0A6A6J9T2_WESOR|nr:HET-domain-containing protein [Westerdykella ornata]KAF2273331.1 HET-domain-containing protein [Westerdykella ornata]
MSINYRPLQNPIKEIRLLELQPPSDDACSRLQARVVHVALESAKYTTLSYVWGDQSQGRIDIEITYCLTTKYGNVEAGIVKTTIGQNLGSALYHLRQPRPLMLWIDAICIDQENESEKTDQVKLMFQIYKGSIETIVWLGPPGPHTDVAMETMTDIGTQFGKFYFREFPELSASLCKREQHVKKGGDHKPSLYSAIKRLLESAEPMDDNGQPLDLFFLNMNNHVAKAGRDEDSGVLVGLRDLWSRTWWHRIWVIQEYVAAQQIRFLCGHAHITSEHMWLTATLYRAYTDQFLNQSLVAEDERCLPAFTTYDHPRIMEFRHDSQAMLLGRPLQYILETVHGQLQLQPPTDPRDNVYALLGLAADTLGVSPDYSRSLEDVFIDVTEALLLEVDGTRALVLCNPPVSSAELPSFAIDWRVIGENLYYFLNHRSLHSFQRPAAVTFQFMDVDELESRGPRIRLTGHTLSRVQRTTLSLGAIEERVRTLGYEEAKEYDFKVRFWHEWIMIAYELFCSLPQGTVPSNAVAATQEMVNIFANRMGVTNQMELNQAVAVALTVDAESAIRAWSHRVWLSRIDIFYRCRSPTATLFATENGLVGHISSPVEPDDHLVAFYGCNVPFVIREVERGVYRLVGPCVVPGLLSKRNADHILETETEEYVLV